MEDQPISDEQNELEQLQYMQLIVEMRQKAFRQIIYGLLWWLASATAMYFAMTSAEPTVYWYGGAIGSLFHWYRAFNMINATTKAGAKPLIKKEAILIAVTVLLVAFSTLKIVPEYFRIETPTIGTCWANSDKGKVWADSDVSKVAPVACWSSKAIAKVEAFSDSIETCPTTSDGYFGPSARESRYSCLSII